MITVRNMLKFFHIDRSANLEVIEAHKERKSQVLSVPLSVRVICIIGVFLISVLGIASPLIIAIGYTEVSLKWLPPFGVACMVGAYFLQQHQKHFFHSYLMLFLLIFGFSAGIIGLDAYLDDARGTLVYMTVAATLLLLGTYNVFNNGVYHFFAAVFTCALLAILCFNAGTWAVQVMMASLLLLSLLIFLYPFRWINLYTAAKAIIVFVCTVGFALTFDNEFMENSDYLRWFTAVCFLLAGVLSLLYKKKPKLATRVPLIALMFLVALFSSYGVGLSFILVLLAYLLSSISVFCFGLIAYVAFSSVFFIHMEISYDHKLLLLGGFGVLFLVLSLMFRGGDDV